MNAMNVLEVFLVVTQGFQLLANYSSAALPCKRFVSKRMYNLLFVRLLYTNTRVIDRVT